MQNLGPGAVLYAEMQAEREKSLKPTPEQIRERARYYEQQAKEAG